VSLYAHITCCLYIFSKGFKIKKLKDQKIAGQGRSCLGSIAQGDIDVT